MGRASVLPTFFVSEGLGFINIYHLRNLIMENIMRVSESAVQILRTEREEFAMKKLVAAIVLVGTLSVASGAMAYGDGRQQHNQPRGGGKIQVEHSGKDSGFGVWITIPQAKAEPDRMHHDQRRGNFGNHRHDRHEQPRFRHRS
jgi:hypothetical protein